MLKKITSIFSSCRKAIISSLLLKIQCFLYLVQKIHDKKVYYLRIKRNFFQNVLCIYNLFRFCGCFLISKNKKCAAEATHKRTDSRGLF